MNSASWEFALDKCLVDDDPGGDVTNSLPAKLPSAFASAQSSAASDPSHPKCSERISIVRDGELAVERDLTIDGVTRKVVFTVEGPTAAYERSMGQYSCGRFGYDQDQPQRLRLDLECGP